MFQNIFSIIARFFSAQPRSGRSTAALVAPEPGTHQTPAAEYARTIPHTELSPFARWVSEMDDEVTEYISGQRLTQILLQSEKKSAAVKQRQTARRRREMLMRPIPART